MCSPRTESAAAEFIVFALGFACVGVVGMVAGALFLGPSDGSNPPYLRFLGFAGYAAGLGVTSYDAAIHLMRKRTVAAHVRGAAALLLVGGSGYFLVFFALAPKNVFALFVASPGVLGLA